MCNRVEGTSRKHKLFKGCEEYVSERLSSSVGRCCQTEVHNPLKLNEHLSDELKEILMKK